MCLCVEGGGGEAYLYYLEVGFPPTHVWKVIKCLGGDSSSKCTRTGARPGSADPTLAPLVLILCWLADMWAIVSFLMCIMRGAPVCSAKWAFFVSG